MILLTLIQWQEDTKTATPARIMITKRMKIRSHSESSSPYFDEKMTRRKARSRKRQSLSIQPLCPTTLIVLVRLPVTTSSICRWDSVNFVKCRISLNPADIYRHVYYLGYVQAFGVASSFLKYAFLETDTKAPPNRLQGQRKVCQYDLDFCRAILSDELCKD